MMKANSDMKGCCTNITTTSPSSENRSRTKDVTSVSTTERAACALCVRRVIKSEEE